MDKKIQILIGALVVIILISAGLSFANEKTKDEKKTTENIAQGKAKEYFTLKLVDSSGTGISVPYVAEELGYFEEEGIKIDWKGIVATGQQLGAVLSGTLDVGGGHVNRHIAAIASGANIKVVIATKETTKEEPHLSFLVLENSSIRNATDLVGKKIGMDQYGGCQEYPPYEYLVQNGIQNPKGKFEIVMVPTKSSEQLLRQGEIDAVHVTGMPEAILKRGGVRVLFTDYDLWGTEGGLAPSFFSNDFIKKNPDAVRGYVKAIARANDWINMNNSNKAEAKRITSKRTGIKVEEMTSGYYAEHGIIEDSKVQVWLDLLENYGEIKPGLKPSDIYTNEFNPYYKK